MLVLGFSVEELGVHLEHLGSECEGEGSGYGLVRKSGIST